MFRRGILGAALVAAVLVPAASASSAHRVKLSLVPLPKSALGAAGRSLKLSHGSGLVTNAQAASNATSATPKTFQKLGRVTGYGLTYGDPFSGRAGVTEIASGVELYRTANDAKKGLAFWRKDDAKITSLQQFGLSVTVKPLRAPAVGTRRFGLGTTFAVPGVTPISLVDEQVADGRYVLHISVSAASISAASGVASKLTRLLDHRLRLAEAGRLRAKPVKLLPPLKAGPPAGGPDLSALALTTADLGGQATITDHAYDRPSSPSLSEYTLTMQPAGAYLDLFQIVDWFPSATEASILARISSAEFASGLAQAFPGSSVQFTPVDLSSVGDNAYGGVVRVDSTGQPTVYLAGVVLASGQAVDLVFAASLSQPQAGDVTSLAQATANRLNAGLAA